MARIKIKKYKHQLKVPDLEETNMHAQRLNKGPSCLLQVGSCNYSEIISEESQQQGEG